MKTIKKTMYLVMLITTVLFTACSSDDDGGDDGTAGTGEMTAKVNGNDYQSLEGTAMAQETNSGGVRVIAVSAGTVNAENIQMIVQNFDGVGTYDLNFSNIGTYSYLPDPNNPDPNSVVIYTTVNGTSSTGEISISSYSATNVKGTFSFTGYNVSDNSDTASVTEGSFDLEVTQN